MPKEPAMQREMTGKKFAAILVGGFAIVIAVNFTMATFATRGFSGTVVDNSYVASQKFNGWLEQAEQQEKLGWDAQLARRDDWLSVSTKQVPAGAFLSAQIRRPLGQPDKRELTFASDGSGQFVSQEELPEGRWIVRVTIQSGGDIWVREDTIR
ncbi:FixH family protein [Erythrobacter sp. W53]|uniref:FixH family protein n=1 Tax=Erythrobacter sp. W53 TaxID=3425947 RepID=UPI003D768DBF